MLEILRQKEIFFHNRMGVPNQWEKEVSLHFSFLILHYRDKERKVWLIKQLSYNNSEYLEKLG